MNELAQIRNNELVDLLAVDFQKRTEPNFAWKSACSQFLALPGLRGFWPMSSVDYTAANRAIDISGQGNHLTDNNTPTFGFSNLIPYVEVVNATSQSLSRVDGGVANWADITGNETYIKAADRGLTIGGWFRLNPISTTANEYLMSKVDFAVNTSYALLNNGFSGTENPRFLITTDGFTLVNVVSTGLLVASTWQFVVARFVPSTTLDIYLNNVKTSQAAGIPATIFDSTSTFMISGFQGAGAISHFDGRVSMCFLTATALSDAIIGALFHQTRAMFNV